MFCPRCGLERISEETSFCSRCGFLLTGVSGLLDTGGVPANTPGSDQKSISPRRRGIRQGLFIFLLTFVIAPIVGLISQFGLGIEPWPVGIVIFGLGIGGLLRIVYALMFESKQAPMVQDISPSTFPVPRIGPPKISASSTSHFPYAFPDSDVIIPRSESRTPPSVTDSTTKLLEKDFDQSA